MGTHARLGAASTIRHLDLDCLGIIAAAARGKRLPPPSELCLARREHVRLRRRLDREIANSDELRCELGRAKRDKAAALEEAAKAARARVHAAELDCAALKAQSVRARTLARRERLALVQRSQFKAKRTENEIKAKYGSIADEERRRAAAAERLADEACARADEACAHAADVHGLVAQLEGQLDSLRSHRVSGLLEEVKAKQAKITELGARRKVNQRKLCDAALDRRRADESALKSRRLEEAFRGAAVAAEARGSEAELVDSLEQQLAEARALLKIQTEIAEPSMSYFFHGGSYSLEHDAAALEAQVSCHVSAGQVSKLFFIFSRFFRVKLPSYKRKVAGKRAADGSRTSVERRLFRIGGVTHMKELPAIAGEVHKFQLGEWVVADADANYCYIADGANSQQQEIYAHLVSRRNKQSGKLESMAVSMDATTDKTAAGQAAQFKAAQEAAAEAWAEAHELGLLGDARSIAGGCCEEPTGVEPTGAEPTDAEPTDAEPAGEGGQQAGDEETGGGGDTSAPDFHARRRRDALRAKLRAKIKKIRVTASMNDRAAPARAAGRSVVGTALNGATCAHHAVANIGEEGRKAIDRILKAKMNITDEQADADAAKIKALRTSVGWFSSPACSLIYQVSKYVALFSSKGYAIGENFAQWLAAKLKTTEQIAGELIGHVEDLLAICGGRDYIFFLDAAVVDRFSQLESLYGYLLEEADLGAEAGGKLRKAILTGFQSAFCMAAVRSMAIISDAWLWPMLRAIEPGDEAHILDVCPELWPRVLEWLEEAAASPETAIDGSLCLRTRLSAGGLRVTPRSALSPRAQRRAERAAIDLRRIRAAIAADAELRALVHEMLTDAFTAMAAGVRNHAAEFVGDGRFVKAKVNAELRAEMDGVPLTSVSAETMFARVKRRADRGGISRHDTRMGAVLAERDGTVAWLRNQREGERLWRLARRRWRKGSGSRTMADERRLKGEAKAPEREAKLEKKRGGKAKKASELERLKGVALATKYSELKGMGNDRLSDQLKIFKLLEKKTGFKVSGTGPEMRLQLQSLIFEKFGVGCNDLADGDSGTQGREVQNDGKRRQRKVEGGAGKGKGKGKGKRKRGIVELYGWEWPEDKLFTIDRLIGKMVADGGEVPGRQNIAAGTVLYKVLWDGFPPEIATWETEEDIPCGEQDFVAEYEAALEEEADADDDGSDDEED